MPVARGGMSHLAVTLRDLRRSEDLFYAPVLSYLGYAKVEDTGAMTLWYADAAQAAVNLWQAKPDASEREHDRYAPGFHHFAFAAESRYDVDRLHALLVEKGIAVLDPPAEYPEYMPGYYAVFFADPDGLKFELVHVALPA